MKMTRQIKTSDDKVHQILSKTLIKSKTYNKEICHIETIVFDNGISVITKRILSSENKDHSINMTKIYTKFGKSIFQTMISFKLDILIDLGKIALDSLTENKIKPSNIER